MTGALLSLLLASESLLGFSGHGLAPLFEATAKGTLIILFAVVLTLLLRRSSAATRHLVWTLALGAMLLLPIFSLTLPAWKVPTISPSLADSARERAMVKRKDYTVVLHNDQVRQSQTVSRLAPLTDDTGGYQTWATWILSVWAIGLMLVAMRVAVGEVRVRRLLSCSPPFESGQAKFIVENVRSRLRISRHVKLRISTEIGMPFTWGGFRPTIVLPEDARQWSRKQLNFVLAHELAHVSRYDYLTQMPAQVACAFF